MSDTRTSNSIKNIAFSIFNQLLNTVLAFVSRKIFLMCLSVDYLGISGLFGDIFSMLCLADLGFGTAMTFSMYKPLAEKDYDRLAGLVHFYKKVYRIIAIAIVTIGIALIPFLPYLVNTETEIEHLTWYYILMLANVVASYLVVYKTSIISADQKSFLTTKYTSFFSIARTVLQIAFLLLTHNYTVYLLIQVAFTYITNFFNSYIAEKRYPFIKKKILLPKEDTKGIFSNIKSVFIYKFSSVLITATDNTLISLIVNTTAIGYYSNYTIVSNKINAIVTTIFYSLTASIGNLIVKENYERRYQIFEIMQSVSLILSTFCLTCLLFLQEDFICLWLGEQYLLDKSILYAILTNFYFAIVLMPIWVFREATGLYQKTKYVMLGTAVVNIITSIILGKLIGLAGIIFATSISRLVTYFWYEPFLLFKKYFGKSCANYFLGIGKSIVSTLIVFCVANIASKFILVTNWIWFFIKASVVGIISLTMVFLFYHRSDGFKLLKDRIVGMAKGFIFRRER